MTWPSSKLFHKAWYQPQNAAVIVVGDFESKAMLIRLKALFSGWENQGKLAKVDANPMQNFKQANVLLVDKADATETRYFIGGKGITRDNPDYVAVTVINTILGGRFTSWLNDALRVNAGLTYGASSRFSAMSNAGTFYIASYTKSDTTVEALDLTLETYQRLFKQGVDADTLNSAKAYVKGQFPPRYETSGHLARLLVEMFGYGFDEQFINTFQQKVSELDPKKAKQIINKYFPKDNLQFVLVGSAAAIEDKVAKYGRVRKVDIKADGFGG